MVEISHDYIFRAIIIGNAGTGKSSFCKTYANGYSCIEKAATIGVDFFAKKHKMEDDKIIKLNLWDTAGQETYKSIISSYFKDICGAIIMFDITNTASFDNVNSWLKQLNHLNTCNHKHPIILVGNKTDLQQRRVISHEEALRYAKKEGLLYVESNSYNVANIETIMHHFYTSIYEEYKQNHFCKGVRPSNNNFSSLQDISLNNKNKCC